MKSENNPANAPLKIMYLRKDGPEILSELPRDYFVAGE